MNRNELNNLFNIALLKIKINIGFAIIMFGQSLGQNEATSILKH